MAQIIPLHRGTHPDHHKGYPRYVRPLTGAEIVSLNGDKDAAHNRADLQARGDHVWDELQKLPRQADLGDWLERGRRERRQRLQALVAVGSLVVAWFCIVFFAFQLGRGAL